MTGHLAFEQLCDLGDGVLAGAESARARAHLASCADCASRSSALTTLAAHAAALSHDIAPPDDLWPDIRAGIEARGTPRRLRLPSWGPARLLAAAAVIAIASSALTLAVVRQPRSGAGSRGATATAELSAPEGPAAPLPARLASAEHEYARSVATLQRTLDERRDSLAASTVSTVERSLRVADSAIAEARTALARDPANRALAALFASNYERKIDLLRRATELAPRT